MFIIKKNQNLKLLNRLKFLKIMNKGYMFMILVNKVENRIKATIAIIFHTVEQISLKKIAMQFRLLAPLWRHCGPFFLIFSTSQLH